MKKLLLLTLLTFGAGMAVNAKDHNPVSILSTHGGLLYLKFHKSMLGAHIEIRDERDSLILQEIVDSKKIMIDFYYKKAGKYVIKITKGELLQVFSYQSGGTGAEHHAIAGEYDDKFFSKL